MEARQIEGTRDFVIPARYVLHLAPGDRGRALPLLVALHGQGMSAHTFGRILRHLPVASRHLLIPEGPYPFEKRGDGSLQVGYGWYVYRGDQEEFREHLERSEDHLLGILDEVSARPDMDESRVALLGYSQGGYLAGFTGLRHPERFQGLVLASTRLKHEFLEPELAREQHPPTLFVHADNDPNVPWERSAEGHRRLAEAGAETDVHLHDAGHRLPQDAVQAIGRWLSRKGFDDHPG